MLGEQFERDKRLQAKMTTNLIMAKDRLELLGEQTTLGYLTLMTVVIPSSTPDFRVVNMYVKQCKQMVKHLYS